MEDISMPVHYASADEPALKDRHWIEQQWQLGRNLARKTAGLLILDEIQKISNWSETVKKLWDEDTATNLDLYTLFLGSSSLLIKKGLSESLAGRFEVTPITHWTFPEMREAFGWDLDQYLFFGGYPGSAPLISDEERWLNYIRQSLIETSISRDILLMTRVDKPALLRRLFELGCLYSGQILSYQKMLGQLQDAGNTTTLAHYLDLLNAAGLICGLSKYSGKSIRQRASSPKLITLNTALFSSFSNLTFENFLKDTELRGRLVETAVGAYLANAVRGKKTEVYYWSAENQEVDFVLTQGKNLLAIEVKSGRRRTTLPGLKKFLKRFSTARTILVGADGIPLEEFLKTPPERWFI